MKNKILIFLMVASIFCALIVGCADNQTDNIQASTNVITQDAATEGTDASNIDAYEVTEPTETDTTIPSGHIITYSEYVAMTGEQKKNIMKQFPNKVVFEQWLAEIKQDYEHYMTTIKPVQVVDPKPSTEPTESTGPIFPDVTDTNAPEKDELTYLEYHNLSADEQKAFINTFDSIDAFFEWYSAARKAYEDSLIKIDGTTPIDAGEILDNNNLN